jgi:Flp pilus assembly pilin Flp
MATVLIAVERLLRKDDGQDLIEYGLLAVLIAVAAVITVRTLGQTINTVLWQVIVQAVQSA